jgi:hypothetical protein
LAQAASVLLEAHNSPYSTEAKLRYIDFIVATRTLLPSWSNAFQLLAGRNIEPMNYNLQHAP